MKMHWMVSWPGFLGLALLLALVPSRGLAAEVGGVGAPPAKAGEAGGTPLSGKVGTEAPAGAKKAVAERVIGRIGTVVAVVPDSFCEKPVAERRAQEGPPANCPKRLPVTGTLVVDVHQGKEVLRVGTWILDKTKITAKGAPASFESLKEGARVRVDFRKVPAGDVATAVAVLGGAQ